MSDSRLLAFAQLLRLPNVFTAFADIALATAFAATLLHSTPPSFWFAAVLLALASGSLYLAGMVWNDIFDRAEDAVSRPRRPLPSGRVPVGTAVFLGIVLMLSGLLFGALAGFPYTGPDENWNDQPVIVAGAIALAVIIYDCWLKRTPLGPLGMGSCRFLNVLLGLSTIPGDTIEYGLQIHLAGIVGLYIVGVTWFARTEEGRSNRRQLVAAAFVMLLALLLAIVLKSRLPLDTGTFWFPYLLVAFGIYVGGPALRAIHSRGPREVQAAVKRCVLGLIGLDAVLAAAFVGLPGLFILLLLPPALVIGKWVYST